MTMITNRTSRVLTALIAGAAYGLLLRLSFENSPALQIISRAFLLLAPCSVGAISVLVAAGRERIPASRQISISAYAMGLFLAAMFAFFLEGLICILLVVPIFMFASIFGGLVAGWLHNALRARGPTIGAFALLPFLLGPVEAAMPPESSIQEVSRSIHIDATPEQVFDQLANVKDIAQEELGYSFMHMIGLPRPLQADMHGSGTGAVRVSQWEKGVRFEEVITSWERGHVMHYRFNIPPGSIPRDALDRHVELGGEYFTVTDGGYDLAPAPGGGTTLTLTTRFLNRSHLKTYGDLWGRLVLQDFHGSILGLMKNRAEAARYGSSSTGKHTATQ
jgi:hypothetical protein